MSGKRDRAVEIYALTKQANRLILKETAAEDVIPLGTVIKTAMGTSLDKLGDMGHLSPDGTHAQEGLPCLLQSYMALLWLPDRLDIDRSVEGLPVKITTQIYSSINVPGANVGTGVIPGTDAENRLAQEITVTAYEQSREMFADEISS